MPLSLGEQQRFTNPLLDLDVPDPDAIALSTGGFALVASSFDREPGLPLWHSDDLMTWRPVGFAGGHRPDAPHDGGVWAPSIREHDGRLYLTWGDPDLGVFVTESEHLAGPWSEPRLVLAGRGLIDPCPYWDETGRAWIVHGYARSRAGFANRIDVFEVDRRLSLPLSGSRTVIDGDRIPGCSVLEGPKIYSRDGELWIFAPAGGVATGWQYAFRAPSWAGPWEHRIVLDQGSTPVNGPHQGAWVVGADGEEWFLHFQAKGALGRVLHLQPLSWAEDGWPLIGDPETPGAPVASWPTPRGGTTMPPPSPAGDGFAADELSAAWHTRGAGRSALVPVVGGGRIRLAGHPDGALLRPLDGAHRTIEVRVLRTDGAAAAFVVSDARVRELRLDPEGRTAIVTHEPDGIRTEHLTDSAAGARLGLRVQGTEAAFTLDGEALGEPFLLEGRRWTGTEWGLAARGDGTVTFGPVEVSA